MREVRVAVIYYSSTGNTYRLAQAMESAAKEAGAEVRLRRVAELAPDEAIDQNPAWRAHIDATQDVPVAAHDDLDWADVYLIGTPSRFGNVSSQMKQFLDTAGGLWAQGKLANKVVSVFTSADNPHGGQEMTINTLYTVFHHWSCVIVSPGYSDQVVFAAGGNPYGTSVVRTADEAAWEAVLQAANNQAKRAVGVARALLPWRLGS